MQILHLDLQYFLTYFIYSSIKWYEVNLMTWQSMRAFPNERGLKVLLVESENIEQKARQLLLHVSDN